MQKQLNFELLGIDRPSGSQPLGGGGYHWSELKLEEDLVKLGQSVAQLREITDANKRDLLTQIDELKNHLKNLHAALKILEENDHRLAKALQTLSDSKGQQKNELKVLEEKVSEMIHRHQKVVAQYDQKFQSMQELLHKNQSLLVSYQAQLFDAKNELARLKKA